MFDLASKVAEGKTLWGKIIPGQEPDMGQLVTYMQPLGDFKDALYPSKEIIEVTDARRPALRMLLENPETSKALTAIVKSDDNLRIELARIFKDGSEQEITGIIQNALKDPNSIRSVLKADAPKQEKQEETKPEKPAAPEDPLRSEFSTSHIFTSIHTLNQAQDMAQVPGLKFHTGNGKYESGVVNEQSIQQISFQPVGAAEPKYFKRVHNLDSKDGEKGLAAAMWQEINADGTPAKSNKVYVSFPGYNGTPHEAEAMFAVGDGKLNPQTAGIDKFIEDGLKKLPLNDKTNLVVGAGSLGSSNALTAKIALEKKGIDVDQTIIHEPAAASLAAQELIRKDPAAKEILNDGTISFIRTFTRDEAGNVTLSNTAMLQPGASKSDNFFTSINGRAGTLDKLNETFGHTYSLDLTGRPNNSKLTAGQYDPLHAGANIAAAFQDNAALKQEKLLPTPREETPSVAKLKQIIDQNPNFEGVVDSIIIKSMTNGGAQMDDKAKALAMEIYTNPEKIEPLAQLVQHHPEVANLVQQGVSGAADPETMTMVTALINDPAAVKKLDDAITEHPHLLDVLSGKVSKEQMMQEPMKYLPLLELMNDPTLASIAKAKLGKDNQELAAAIDNPALKIMGNMFGNDAGVVPATPEMMLITFIMAIFKMFGEDNQQPQQQRAAQDLPSALPEQQAAASR